MTTTYILIVTLWFTGLPDKPRTYSIREIPSLEACKTLRVRMVRNFSRYTTKQWSECVKEERV